MVWEIPYTFIAGTKAKANEVNSNFTSIKQFVDQLESNQATNELDISNLEANKADLNGSQETIFQVANAINNKDAVNLETLKDKTANTLDTIRGFVPSKSSSNTISCTAGDCWDSTYEVMISSPTSLSLQDTNLSADTTYYIYVCYNEETSGCQLAFSTNSSTPSLPVGYGYFRKLGKFVTDEDGNIDIVMPPAGGIAWIIDTYVNGTSGYILYSNGLCEQWGVTKSSRGGTPRTVTLIKAYSNSNYFVVLTSYEGGSAGAQYNNFQCTKRTPESFTAKAGCNESIVLGWQTIGYVE